MDNLENLEIPGKFKSTTVGNVDWYYGGGIEAWSTKSEALLNVPISVRSGRTIGIREGTKIIEYIWHPSDVSDLGLVEKNLAKFETELPDSLKSPYSFGSIEENTTVSFYKSKESISEIFEAALFPEQQAYIKTPHSLTLSGVADLSMEVGTPYSTTLTVVYNPGEVANGNDTIAGPVKGAILGSILKNVQGDNVINNSLPSSNTYTHILTNFPLIFGDNSWSVIVTYDSSLTTYVSNYNNPNTHLSSSLSAGTFSANSTSIKGRYKRWHYVGSEATSPNSSVSVRTLGGSSLLDENNEGEFLINVLPGSAYSEVSVYVPEGKNLLVVDQKNLNIDISEEFFATAITVNDAGGVPVSYTKFTRVTGPTGYKRATTFKVNII